MTLYKKLNPDRFEAIQYTGDNLKEVLEFTGKHPMWDTWFKSFEEYQAYVTKDRNVFKLISNSGNQEVHPTNWIIKYPHGYLHKCTDGYFKSTYEPA